jgi:dipeptidase
LPLVWTTGCSTPCISLYKPYLFGNEPKAPVFRAGDPKAEAYWRNRERFHRSVLGLELPREFYDERDALESAWMKTSEGIRNDAEALRELAKRAARDESDFYAMWEKKLPKTAGGSFGFRAYWVKKNSALDSTVDS